MTPEQTAAPALPLHPQDEMECRRCGVHCDKVVYPGACLARGCPFVYSYEAWGHTYVGCMQKVYDVEIDLDMLRAAEKRKPGFGAILARRRPLPMCKAEIERTYESRRRRARLRQSGVRRAAGRRADVPDLRPDQERLSSDVLAPPADVRVAIQTSQQRAGRSARRARARRRRRSRASGTRRRGRAAGRARGATAPRRAASRAGADRRVARA